MNLFNLFATISLDKADYDKGVKEATDQGESLASNLGSGLAKAGQVAAKGLAVIGTAATGAVAGLLALESSTEEYRIAQGKLNTAFEAAGYGAETAQEAYNAFYGILGDTDTATEASQLLAKLADSEEDVATWTNIAAGVSGTFGDSLPIEGLIEASNETAKVGQVTGVLADALNWAGISEDEFNAKLEACSSESERNQLIMDTLSGTYDEASEAFYRNNEALVESRKNQAQLDATLATLGQTVSNVKNRFLSEMLPTISQVVTAFSDMINGVEGADQEFSTAVQGMVASIVSSLPQFLDFGVQIIASLLSGILQSIPTLVAAVPQVVSSIVSALSTLIPQVLEQGVNLLRQFANGIETGLPEMVARLPEIIQSFVQFITDNLPSILEQGVEIINSLVNGIIDSIPVMLESLPEIITSFIQFITDNLPTIIDAGIDILLNLVSGIVSAIPRMIAAIPKIIRAYTEGIASAFPKIIQSGVKLLQQFWEGIASNIPELVSNLPQIIDAIIDGIGNLMGGIVDVGKNIVRGLWEGISSMGGWIGEKVGGFFDGIVGGVMDFLGINSPSKLFRDEIGKNIGLGVAAGLEDSEDEAVRAASDLAKSVYDQSVEWLDRQSKYQKFSLQDQLDVWKAIQSQFIEGSEQYADAEEEIFDLRQKIREEELEAEEAFRSKVEEINQNIVDIENSYQEALSSRAREIFNSYSLFDSIPERQEVAGESLISNLQSQISTMEEFYSGLDELTQRGVGEGLVQEIREMGPDAANQLSALLALSDEKLSEYADLYKEKQDLANSVAMEELKGLREETTAEIESQLEELTVLYNQQAPEVGLAFSTGLANGIRSGMSLVTSAAEAVARAAEAAVRSATDTHSPSRVFEKIGGYMAEGLALGWENEIGKVRQDISRGMDFGTASVDFASSGLGIASAGMVNGISSAVQSAGGAASYTFNLLFPDYTKLASYTFQPMVDYAKANGTPILSPS